MSKKVTKKKKRKKKELRRCGFTLFEFCKIDGAGVPVGKRFRQEQFWGSNYNRILPKELFN